MVQNPLPAKWLELLLDPYAILGTSINADENHLRDRYYSLAKLLHPDTLAQKTNRDQELAQAIFTHLINPAYARIKQKEKRLSQLTMLRLAARTFDQQQMVDQKIFPFEEMTKISPGAAELMYEEAINRYAQTQYKSLNQSYQLTYNLRLLNLFYLSLQPDPTVSRLEESTETIIPEKNHSLSVLPNYAQRHYERATEYARQENWTLAVQELRDAIKLEKNNSDYYALLGVVHLRQGLPGMAQVYLRQALKINPQQPLAMQYAALIKSEVKANPQSMGKAVSIAALLSRFLSGKRS